MGAPQRGTLCGERSPKGALLPRWPSAGGEHGGLWGDEVWQSASPQGNGASWLLFRQIRYAFRICPKDCFSFCPTARRTDCHVAPLLAMTGRNLPGVCGCKNVIPGEMRRRCVFAEGISFSFCATARRTDCRFAPRNDRQKSAGRLRLPGSAAGVLPGSVLAPAEILNHSLGQTPTRLRLCPAGSSYGLSSPEASSWRGAGGLWG